MFLKVDDSSDLAVDKINGLLESFMGINDTELGKISFERVCLYTRSSQTKDYKIGICCLSAKHIVLRRKSRDWLACNQNNVFKWSYMSTHGLLFQ